MTQIQIQCNTEHTMLYLPQKVQNKQSVPLKLWHYEEMKINHVFVFFTKGRRQLGVEITQVSESDTLSTVAEDKGCCGLTYGYKVCTPVKTAGL